MFKEKGQKIFKTREIAYALATFGLAWQHRSIRKLEKEGKVKVIKEDRRYTYELLETEVV